jgi:hypothetical protein
MVVGSWARWTFTMDGLADFRRLPIRPRQSSPPDVYAADSSPARYGTAGASSQILTSLQGPPRTTPSSIHQPIPPLLLTSSAAMASRRLAFNLQQSLRSRQALNAIRHPLQRGLATPVSHGSKTESTTLSNGFTVSRTRLNWPSER